MIQLLVYLRGVPTSGMDTGLQLHASDLRTGVQQREPVVDERNDVSLSRIENVSCCGASPNVEPILRRKMV